MKEEKSIEAQKNRKAKPFGLVQTHEAARVALQHCPILRSW
jgi:hypothetical protein